MPEPEPDEAVPGGTDPRVVRRDAVARLATAVRALADAVVETAVAPDELDAITAEIGSLTARVASATDDRLYAGLVWPPGDFSVPEGTMPLNPIIGACSPSRPDVQLHFADREVVGRGVFGKRFVGPPGYVHGGIGAMLADQIAAVTPLALGVQAVTRSLAVRYRRPLPLGEELELWGVCEPIDDGFRARFTVTARGEVAVDGTAELVPRDRQRPAR